MKILVVMLAVFLTACQTPKLPPVEQKVVTKYEYIVRIPPAEMFEVPAAVVMPKDVSELKQSEVAKILNLMDKRQLQLEERLRQIAIFLNDAQKQAAEKK